MGWPNLAATSEWKDYMEVSGTISYPTLHYSHPVQKHPQVAGFSYKGFPNYDIMSALMPSPARGTHAFLPSQQGSLGDNAQDSMAGVGEPPPDGGDSVERAVEMDVDSGLTRNFEVMGPPSSPPLQKSCPPIIITPQASPACWHQTRVRNHPANVRIRALRTHFHIIPQMQPFRPHELGRSKQ